MQTRASGNCGMSILRPDHSPQGRGGKGPSGVQCLFCLPSLVPAQGKRFSPGRGSLRVLCGGKLEHLDAQVKPSTRLPFQSPLLRALSPPAALNHAAELGLWLPPAKSSPCCASWQPFVSLNPKLGDPDLYRSTLVTVP